MDLTMFFKQEIVSSAFLGTVLAEFRAERDVFFELLGETLPACLINTLKSLEWKVELEHQQIDIYLSAKEEKQQYVLFIENKIAAGSKQKSQLLKYYKEQKKSTPGAKILAVYLAPGGVGLDEVDEVNKSCQPVGDWAVHLSWNGEGGVLERLAAITQEDFVKKCLVAIGKSIEARQVEKYPLIDGREKIEAVVSDVRMRLKASGISLGVPWPAADMYTLGTQGTNVTAWLRFKFEAEAEEPYRPLDLYDGENMKLTFQSMLKLSAAGARDSELKTRWKALEQQKELNVEGVGLHKLEGRWFTFEQRCVAPKPDLTDKFATLGSSVLRFVQSWGNVSSNQKAFKAGGGEG